MAGVLVAVLPAQASDRAEGAAAVMDPHAILQEMRSTVSQQTPFGTAGNNRA